MCPAYLVVSKTILPTLIFLTDTVIRLNEDYKTVDYVSLYKEKKYKNFKLFFYHFYNYDSLLFLLLDIRIQKQYKLCLLSNSTSKFTHLTQSFSIKSIETRILRIETANELDSVLDFYCHLSGIGQIIAVKRVNNSLRNINSVDFLLSFPTGTSRFKSKLELLSLSENFYKIRLKVAVKERFTIKQRKRKRRISSASVFKLFLIKEFSISLLNSGSGVIDVAGGKGELSFKLNRYKIKSTIVDPREPKNGILKYLTKDHILRKTNNKQQFLNIKMPNHLRCWFSFGNIKVNEKVLSEETCDLYAKDELINLKEASIKLKRLLENSSIIIGLHPDQATEYIIDYCLKYKKPFAVIPCCVFFKSKLFKHRKHIKTYQKFIQFLINKNKQIKQKQLGFPGRNICLYYKP